MSDNPITELREWLKERMEFNFSEARAIENDGLKRGDGSQAERIFLWRARGTAYSEVLQYLDDKEIR